MKKHINKLISNPLFSGSAIMLIGSTSASVLNYLYHLIVGRLLGPSAYGELASIISVAGLLGVIPAAANLVIVKQISSAENPTEVNSLINWFKTKMFLLSLSFTILILILSPFISSFLKISKLSYLILISVSFLFSLQSGFNRAILQGLLKFKELVISILAENASKLLMSVIFIMAGFAVNGAMFSFVLASFFGFALVNHYLKIKDKPDSHVYSNLKPMFLLVLPVLIQSISTTSIYSSDVILVKHFFSSYEAGIYASLSTLGKIIFFGVGPISSVMFPLVSIRNTKGGNYRKILFSALAATTVFALAVCLFYLFLPEVAINLLFGSLYLKSAKLLIWFGTFMTLFALSFLLINFGISLGRNKIVIFPLIFSVLQIILIYLFHQTLLEVVFVSNIVNALLLIALLIYLNFEKGFKYGKNFYKRGKVGLNNSPSI
ncbi:oligosaccharide flippase family protein [Candidatus Daviesbacteria bacterium]|nr:oligosaccharide flippase family protein [Candidatus Daviesbacteria bacterium]